MQRLFFRTSENNSFQGQKKHAFGKGFHKMLSQETSKGALGGKAEVTKPGGKMDGQAGKELQCSHISAELGLLTVGLMHFSLSWDRRGREKGRRGRQG